MSEISTMEEYWRCGESPRCTGPRNCCSVGAPVANFRSEAMSISLLAPITQARTRLPERRRALREMLCRQRSRCWGAAGRGIGSDLVVGTGVAHAFPPTDRLSTSSATSAPRSRRPDGFFVRQLQPTLPRRLAIPRFRPLPRFACLTTIAAQSVLRKIKNRNHFRLRS